MVNILKKMLKVFVLIMVVMKMFTVHCSGDDGVGDDDDRGYGIDGNGDGSDDDQEDDLDS